MRSPEIIEKQNKLIAFVANKFQSGELDNEALVELFKAMGSYLNLMTISDYAKANNMSYQGVSSCRKIETIFGVKFVIDND